MVDDNTAHRQELVREQTKTAITAYRAMLDAYVNNPAQRTASQAEQVHLRQPRDSQSKNEK